MRNLFAKLRSLPARYTALIAVIVAAIAVPMALYAWGPSDRPTFTWEKPATYVTFNSMTNNPKQGDERDFVKIRNVTDNHKFAAHTDLVAGKEYEVFVYYHNNASTTYNDAVHNYAGIARGAFMRVEMPDAIKAGQTGRLNAFVGANNARPAQVWDEVTARNTTGGDINLRYTPGSARITSNGKVNGQTIDLNALAGKGAALGYDALDGNLPGCEQFAGYVTYRFVVDQPNFEVQKQVRLAGNGSYTEQVTANVGDEVEFRIKYKNIGTIQQKSVSISDQLPSGLSYIPGSTFVSNKSTGNKWQQITTDAVVANGIDVGGYLPGGAAYVKLKAKVVADGLQCGANTLTNTASATTANGVKKDTASVVVTKDCPPAPQPKDITVCRLSDKQVITIKENQFDSTKHSKNLDDCKEAPKPVYTCDALTIVKIARDEFQFEAAQSSSNGAVYKSTTFKVFDANGKEVYNSANGNFKGFAAGSYTVRAFVTFTVNGKDETVSSQGCEKQFTIDQPEPKDIVVCRLSDKKYPVTIKETEFDSKLHSKNPEDCKEAPQPKKITVCVIETGVVTTINEQDFDAKKHTNDLSKCEKVQRCFIPEKRIVEIARKDITDQHTEDLSKCAPAPVTPPVTPPTPPTPSTPPVAHELPRTGADAWIGGLGLGALITAGAAYIASRRTLG